MNEPQIVWRGLRAVIVDKPAGWLSVPGRGPDQERRCVGPWLQASLGQRLWPVHRLDAPVSGLLVFALDERAHRALNTAFEARQLHKTYEALALPSPDQALPAQPQRWESLLLRGKRRAYEHPQGKPSITEAEPPSRVALADGRAAWLWRLHPLTGRPHQLRVHMARFAQPILGDALYGGPPLCGPWLQDQAQAQDEHEDGALIALRAVSLELGPLAQPLELPERVEASGLMAWLS